jgi:hypothetical protein
LIHPKNLLKNEKNIANINKGIKALTKESIFPVEIELINDINIGRTKTNKKITPNRRNISFDPICPDLFFTLINYLNFYGSFDL